MYYEINFFDVSNLNLFINSNQAVKILQTIAKKNNICIFIQFITELRRNEVSMTTDGVTIEQACFHVLNEDNDKGGDGSFTGNNI